MELNLENKAKFFAQYWGQPVFRQPYFDQDSDSEEVQGYCIKSNKGYLKLKPLSLITDEDAINVEFEGGSSHFIKVLESYGYEFNDLILKHHQIDYLRSKGYALPWLNLSINDLVNCGWIKLTV